MRLADLRTEFHDGLLFAYLNGEVDISNADNLRDAIATATPNDALGVVLDLSAVDYLDSAGIHLVFRLRDSLRTRAQGLRLVIPETSLVNETLRLAGIERGKEIVDSAEAAQQAITAAADTLARP